MISLSLLVIPLLMQPSIPLVSTSHRHSAHLHWACCPPGRQIPLHRPQVDLSLCCIPGLCFPRCKNTCLYSIYTYTCLCSIWFVLYSSSAFNWLCARAAQKVWVSPQCTHSTAHGGQVEAPELAWSWLTWAMETASGNTDPRVDHYMAIRTNTS